MEQLPHRIVRSAVMCPIGSISTRSLVAGARLFHLLPPMNTPLGPVVTRGDPNILAFDEHSNVQRYLLITR
jgi:hypothetical protein